MFELQGGGSSLYQGYGGALNVWGDRFEGNVGLGYLDGLRFSVFLKQLIGRDTLRLGNDAIPVRFATDVFGSSHIDSCAGCRHSAGDETFVALRIRRRERDRHSSAVRECAAPRSSHWCRSGGTLAFADVRLTTHASLLVAPDDPARDQVGVANRSRGGSDGGVGGNQPYGSASMAIKHEKLTSASAYVSMGDRFRRTGVPTPGAERSGSRERAAHASSRRTDSRSEIGRQTLSSGFNASRECPIARR